MFTEKSAREKGSIGTATLAIAAYHLGTASLETDISEIGDVNIAAKCQLPLDRTEAVNRNSSFCPPIGIIETAKKLNLSARPYINQDMNLTRFSEQLKGFKKSYIDSVDPSPVTPQGLLGKVNKDACLQLMVYIDGDPLQMHWLLLQIYGTGTYIVHDASFGTIYPVSPFILNFNALFDTSRRNNYLGFAVLLSKQKNG